ncbi:hypothetical protein LZ24_01845 [Desulfobotulus alkaliphilus]|uniref:Uncharacterized protein n=1 Tax=Desulfobotulus alkaliphilus TaxID=622671 RepID=A0A562RRX5_9BACT|nr:hypothetical protein [Desulfobotulus alkaliphilus]TWI71828.1 hypothetical protein LZ24_01845 [Desulfobotulus alkaliphilus]
MTVKKLIMLVEDDPEINSSLELGALRYFGADTDVELCVGQSIPQVSEFLENYAKTIPEAKIYAILDYNLSNNFPGEQKPAEALFYNNDFQHFLKNGGIVIIYNGYPEQVIQSKAIMQTHDLYPDIAFFLAEKTKVPMEDIFKVIKAAVPEKLSGLRKHALNFNHDLSAMIKTMRAGQKRAVS